MPLYNYVCDVHGEFVDWRPMRESAAPAPCPDCRHLAQRAVSLPSLALMNSATRKAHGVNERSADSPKVVRTGEPGAPLKCDHGHGGHGHAHGHAGSRPWMIGH